MPFSESEQMSLLEWVEVCKDVLNLLVVRIDGKGIYSKY